MSLRVRYGAGRFIRFFVAAAAGLSASAAIATTAGAFIVKVVDTDGNPVSGFRYLVEKDNTNQPRLGVPSTKVISLETHKSHAPVVKAGHTAGSQARVNLPRHGRYFVSVLPDDGHTMSGAARKRGQGVVVVTVHRQPIPTAQITVFAFVDNNPINNGWDETEPPVGGATVVISDAGGPMLTDAFGNPLGTRYLSTCDATWQNPGTGTSPCLDPEGAPIVDVMGSGVITTLTQDEYDGGPATNPLGILPGEAVIKNLAPGKYGVIVIPPNHDDGGTEVRWVQTTTIEGTPTIDAWVKANEPNVFVEGFGTGFKHVAFGYIKTSPGTQSIGGTPIGVLPWNAATPAGGTATISGTLRWNHFAKPPFNQGFFPGEPVPECWVGLTDPFAAVEAGQNGGLYAAPCNADSSFTIPNVPPGTYNLVWWDRPLDGLFGFAQVTVADGQSLNLGDVLAFRWFGTLKGKVFVDTDQDGFRDETETGGFDGQNLNLRFRDGSVYQTQPTDGTGEYSFSEVFPFFKWLVAEVDFTRYKATGMTTAVDNGGAIPPLAPGQYEWELPSFDALNPQAQRRVNPNTGNNLSRTETGPVLTEAVHLFLNQTNVIDWGKALYGPGENGGISGIVFYDTTRAEDDPVQNGGEPWQPGVPDVQVALYEDNVTNATGERVPDGIIDDVSRDGRVRRADVDNPPFGWADGGRKGPEDVDRNRNGIWDPGDAVAVTYTDSWDRNEPRGCIQNLPLIHGVLAGRCADAYSTWNQVRPGVFDGGYAFGKYFPGGIVRGHRPRKIPMGTYIVEAAPPPGYEIVKEEDKNVDFGDAYVPSELLLPPPCVGKLHTVPDSLTLFPGVEPFYRGEDRPLCDMKQVEVTADRNAAADFFVFTFVPKAARAFGFANNDLSAEFNMASPNFGEKLSPSWIPVSFRDWTGKEVARVYTDEFGHYNTLLPSTFSMNVPAPSGVSPNMMTLVLNDPYFADGTPDPFYNSAYSVTPWTFQYYPGTTSYLDTPLVPVAAFAAHGGGIDTFPTTRTPVIDSVIGPEPGGGSYMCSSRSGAERVVRITSLWGEDIINPAYDPNDPTTPYIIRRYYGFGRTRGKVMIDDTELTILNWRWGHIEALVPDGVVASGRLTVTRSNGHSTEVGARFSILNCDPGGDTVIHVPADYPTIQAAIDAASEGDYIFVAPGYYRENVIMNKPVRLQGSGHGGTRINGDPNPMERLQLWHQRVNALNGDTFGTFLQKDPFMENEAPSLLVVGETCFEQGDIQAVGPGCTGPLDPNNRYLNFGNPFGGVEARVDNFTLFGSKAGGGLFAVAGVKNFVASHNAITNNQGMYAGGVALGIQDNGWDNQQDAITISFNKIHRNGGIQGPGGVALNEFTRNYDVADNLIAGNLTRFYGGGIAHRGYVPGTNYIRRNKILYNENFIGAFLANAGDGGGIFIGDDIVGGTGTGSVIVDGNLIQGNLAGAGSGGGIRAFAMNADDIRASSDPGTWFRLTLTNNIIVDNVAALQGGGISLQDVVLATIENNTIANNDATATSATAFQAGQANSTPRPAGIVANAHSATLAGLLTTAAYTGPNFVDASLVNNIVWHNRSFFNDASLNAGAGGLAPNPAMPYWDLQVVGTPGQLAPQNSLLTSLADSSGDYTNPADANLAAPPSFVAGFENQLTTATVTDEGGNAITVRYAPLLPLSGDYHLNPNSPAIDAGLDSVVAADIDGDPRPAGAYDIGADEYLAGTFTALQVLTPNGGESIPSGSLYTITWGAPAGADHYTVSVSYNGGRRWFTLASGVTTTWLEWAVPTPNTNLKRCLIRVRAYDAGGLFLGADRADETFAIEVVRLLRPNGGELLLGGSTYPVSWMTNGVSAPVTSTLVQRSFDGGRSWRTVTSLPGNPGTFDWAVPDPRGVKARTRLRVKLFAGARRVGIDASDMVFYIRPSLVP